MAQPTPLTADDTERHRAKQAAPLAVALRGISKTYGAVKAVEDVNLAVRRGEIHAIVGENGAGKSTLMKILSGVLQPDSGAVFVDGREKRFRGPADAIAVGIGMVFQHFRLVQAFTVAENVLLGQGDDMAAKPRRVMAQVVDALAERYDLDVNPLARVDTLSVGEQQRVEILKVLYRDARIIVLDEPTAVLTPVEVESFFSTVRSLRDSGTTIILITHKLQEVTAVCDSVTVMRRGRVVAERNVMETTEEELAALMVGAEMSASVLIQSAARGAENPDAGRAPLLEVIGVVPEGNRSSLLPPAVSFALHAGEIVGIVGVEGNGQTELVESLVGLRKVQDGQVLLKGADITSSPVKSRRQQGLAYIPEDRQRRGLVMDFTLRDNLMLGTHYEGSRLISGSGSRALQELLGAYDVRPAELTRRAVELSGGNQQKLVVARELSHGASVVIASNPTRGVDLASTRTIHGHLKAQREAGVAVLLVSADLDEILALCDVVMVMYNGAVVFRSRNVDLDERLLGWYMAGGDRTSAQAGDA